MRGATADLPHPDLQPLVLSGGPLPAASLPCPVWGRAARTLGWGQAGIVAAMQAALLLAGALSIVLAPGSAFITGEQPGVGRAEAGLPCRARRGVAAVPLGWLHRPTLQPSHPRGARSPLGTTAPSALQPPQHRGPGCTRHRSMALPCGNAAASPPAGTTGLAPDPSAKGRGGCGGELPLPPWLAGLSRSPCPTLALSIAQPRAPAAAARLPSATVSVTPAPCPLLPGWCGRGDPCEADDSWLHVEPGMPAGTRTHPSPPSVLGSHPAPLCALPALGQQPRRQRGTTQLLPRPRHSPAALARHSGLHQCRQHVSRRGQSPSPWQLFPRCRSTTQAAAGLG